MDFSDDSLMEPKMVNLEQASSAVEQPREQPTNADLADFELPPYSGSSSSGSSSEPVKPQQSPEKTYSPIAQQQAPSSSPASSPQTSVGPPDLSAVKKLLVSSYSKVSHVFYWRKPIETGTLFAAGATLIIALTFYSIISVVAYSALGLVLASAAIRTYKAVAKMLNKSIDTPFDHIWNKALKTDVSISSEKVHQLVDSSLGNLNASLTYFKQVLLVEDKFATFKFGLFLHVLTYIGAWFNGMTLIALAYVALFTVPIFYEKNKAKIDDSLNLITKQVSSALGMVTTKVTSLVSGVTSGGSKKQN